MTSLTRTLTVYKSFALVSTQKWKRIFPWKFDIPGVDESATTGCVTLWAGLVMVMFTPLSSPPTGPWMPLVYPPPQHWVERAFCKILNNNIYGKFNLARNDVNQTAPAPDRLPPNCTVCQSEIWGPRVFRLFIFNSPILQLSVCRISRGGCSASAVM